MSVVMSNEIVIQVAPEKVFDYVTQPWLWHEWHPNSKSARADVERLAVGDGWLLIRYQLQAAGEGTRFVRTLTFDVSGFTRLLMPALKRQMLKTSIQALANLKLQLESA